MQQSQPWCDGLMEPAWAVGQSLPQFSLGSPAQPMLAQMLRPFPSPPRSRNPVLAEAEQGLGGWSTQVEITLPPSKLSTSWAVSKIGITVSVTLSVRVTL